MLPLYATRIEDLGQGDFVKVDCAACHHVALLTPEALLRACESFDFGSKLYHIWRIHSGSANYILWPECHDD